MAAMTNSVTPLSYCIKVIYPTQNTQQREVTRLPNNREKMLKGDTDQTTDELIDGPVSPRPDVSWSWPEHNRKQSKPTKTESTEK